MFVILGEDYLLVKRVFASVVQAAGLVPWPFPAKKEGIPLELRAALEPWPILEEWFACVASSLDTRNLWLSSDRVEVLHRACVQPMQGVVLRLAL